LLTTQRDSIVTCNLLAAVRKACRAGRCSAAANFEALPWHPEIQVLPCPAFAPARGLPSDSLARTLRDAFHNGG